MEITEANFEAEVIARSNQVPVVVVLWSPRSDASVQLGDALASLAADDAGKWSLVNVNVDTTPRVAQIFGVQASPDRGGFGCGANRCRAFRACNRPISCAGGSTRC